MNLTDQVCSLELAKKLKELGVGQKSMWIWKRSVYDKDFHLSMWRHQGEFEDSGLYCGVGISSYLDIEIEFSEEDYSAFTAAELNEMLLTWGENDRHWHMPWCVRDFIGIKWYLDVPHIRVAKTEADARAKMIIYLLENKLITL